MCERTHARRQTERHDWFQLGVMWGCRARTRSTMMITQIKVIALPCSARIKYGSAYQNIPDYLIKMPVACIGNGRFYCQGDYINTLEFFKRLRIISQYVEYTGQFNVFSKRAYGH